MSGCDLVRSEVAKYSDWDVNTIVAISMAESGCDPARDNLTTSETHRRADGSVICIGSYGALQVGCVDYAAGGNRVGFAANIKVAHGLWQSRQQWGNGYAAWTMYTNGEYRKYL
mgnify:CR=1 FL=1